MRRTYAFGMVWNWAHVHIMINHLPVIAIPLSLLLILIAWVMKSNSIVKATHVYLVFVAIATLGVYWSGSPAADLIVERKLAESSVIHAHSRAAFYAVISSSVLGFWSTLSLWRVRGSGERLRSFPWGTGVLITLSSIVFAWTANRGGKIQHVEIRPAGYVESLDDGGHSSGGHDSSGDHSDGHSH